MNGKNGPPETRAVRNSRVCYDCGLPVHEEEITVCPRCGSQDIDQRRARPSKHSPRAHVELPHPLSRLQLKKGGTVLLSGGPGSGKSTICAAMKPNQICSSEQEVEEVASIWYRVNPELPAPIISSVTTWEELHEDLIELTEGQICVVDSISQLAAGPGSAAILKRAIGHVRSMGAMAIFVTQFTKDGEMLGPNELRHMVDVVATIPDDASGLRRVAVLKNRFGQLFSQYFSIGEAGIRPQEFLHAYSVEGPPGRYSLHLYPMGGAKLSGIFQALEQAGKTVSKAASAAVASGIYSRGFVEPDDAMWRKRFAEEHGLSWIGPEEAWTMLSEKEEEDG